MSVEDIADLVGHAGTSVTEKIYRHQLRPILLKGAVAMDRIFAETPGPVHAQTRPTTDVEDAVVTQIGTQS
jgi:hypothetical protein